MHQPLEHVVYSKNVVEFVTVAREFCHLLEHTDKYTKSDFIQVSIKMLPLLYLKASVLPTVDQQLDEPLDSTVDEFVYMGIKDTLSQKLSAHDDFLEVFLDDMERSDTPVIASVSEGLADVYQDVKNFSSAYRLGVEELMNDALFEVTEHFKAYWGQKLLNTLRALHHVFYSNDDLTEEPPAEMDPQQDGITGTNWYARFQSEWGNDNVS